MKITWIGHACFLVESNEGKVVTDPFDESIGYDMPELSADVITVSHEHGDHNAVGRIGGNAKIIRGEGRHKANGIVFEGIGSFHDNVGGQSRGKNTIFIFRLEGITLAHLGDLGHPLSDDQLAALSSTEVLFIPVGGYYTIGPDEARALIGELENLKVVFPMHYKTDRLDEDFPIVPVENFTGKMENVKQIGTAEVILSKENLPSKLEVLVLNHA